MDHDIFTQSDVDAAITGFGSPNRWRTLSLNCNRHKIRNRFSRLTSHHLRGQNKQALTRQTPPPGKLMRDKIVTARDIDTPRTKLKTLHHNPRLHIIRPTPIAAGARQPRNAHQTFSTIRHRPPIKSKRAKSQISHTGEIPKINGTQTARTIYLTEKRMLQPRNLALSLSWESRNAELELPNF